MTPNVSVIFAEEIKSNVAKEDLVSSMKRWRKTTKKSEISFPVKPYLVQQ